MLIARRGAFLEFRDDPRGEVDEPRENEPPGTNLDDSNVVLPQVLLERQVGISGEQHVKAGRDCGAKKFAVRHSLPTALADVLRLVWREVTRQSGGKVLIEEDARLGRAGDAGFRRFENLEDLLAGDARVLLEEALERLIIF